MLEIEMKKKIIAQLEAAIKAEAKTEWDKTKAKMNNGHQ